MAPQCAAKDLRALTVLRVLGGNALAELKTKAGRGAGVRDRERREKG